MIWEIFAEGDEPYPGLNNTQARAKIVVLDYRMKFPDEAPTELVQVIDTCWKKDPDMRQTMVLHSSALQLLYENKLPLLFAQTIQATSLPPGTIAQSSTPIPIPISGVSGAPAVVTANGVEQFTPPSDNVEKSSYQM